MAGSRIGGPQAGWTSGAPAEPPKPTGIASAGQDATNTHGEQGPLVFAGAESAEPDAASDTEAETVDPTQVDVGLGHASPAEPDVPGLSSEADWLDRICPYLLSEDGTYRSTEPDPDHRCMAQDPPGTLPIAFQERYCLTERHVRCEMYKYAQSAREAALGGQEGVPAAQVSSARFRPSVRSVPLTLGPSRGATSNEGARKRPTGILVAAGIALVLVLLVLLALVLNGLGGGTGPDASPTPQLATAVPLTPAPSTPEPTTAVTPDSEGSQPPATVQPAGEALLIEYEVQEGEALVRIAETFGTSRNRILDANEGMREQDPYTEPGDTIIVPVSPEMTAEEIESQPGFIGYAE